MNKNDWVKFSDLKKELFKDKKFKKGYDELEFEYALKSRLIEKRIKNGYTQKQLAESIGIHQSLISKLESGNYNPSVNFLRKVAKGLNAKLKITIT